MSKNVKTLVFVLACILGLLSIVTKTLTKKDSPYSLSSSGFSINEDDIAEEFHNYNFFADKENNGGYIFYFFIDNKETDFTLSYTVISGKAFAFIFGNRCIITADGNFSLSFSPEKYPAVTFVISG